MEIIFGWVEWEGGEIGIMVRLGGVMDFGVGVWMNQLCEISKYSDNLLVLTTPRLNIQTINESHYYFTPKNRYFIGHNTI